MFNCGEGAQRLCSEHHLKIRRLSNVFITRPTWSNLGGLPGIVMALRDQGATMLSVHGPRRLDRAIRVTYAPLSDHNGPTESVDEHSRDTAATCNTCDECREPLSMCYVVRVMAPRRRVLLPRLCAERGVPCGKERALLKEGDNVDINGVRVTAAEVTAPACSRPVLCPRRCAKRGVPPSGELRRKLKDGFSVILPDGTEVSPEDVSVPQSSLGTFLVVDVPSERFVLALENCAILTQNSEDVALIIHFTSSTVVNCPRYQRWMRRFPSARHLLLDEHTRVSGDVKTTAQQVEHHEILPAVFPELQNSGVPSSAGAREIDNDELAEGSAFEARAMLQYHLLPHTGVDRSAEPYLNTNELLEAMRRKPDVERQLNLLTESRVLRISDPHSYPRVTFLGTGAAVPSPLRNTSSIILELGPERSVLLDCAEGSVGQMLRLLGEAGTYRLLGTVRAVFLSHAHADHVLGLPGLLRARRTLPGPPPPALLVIAPAAIASFVHAFNNNFQRLLSDNISFITNSELEHGGVAANRLQEALGLGEVRTAPVQHYRAKACHALALSARDWKITYSGDTSSPCQELEQLGMDSTLLIHEATLEDGLQQMAHRKGHSTPSEALAAARRMKARFTILTHFSQRYARVPRIDEIHENNHVGVAFDNMTVSLNNLHQLPTLFGPLRAVYAKSIERLQNRALRRGIGRGRGN